VTRVTAWLIPPQPLPSRRGWGGAAFNQPKAINQERGKAMPILQSINGQFYQVPDDEADKCLVPADKVEETLRAAGIVQQQQQQPCCAPGGAAGAPSVIIYVMGDQPPQIMTAGQGVGPQNQVQAYGHHHHHGHHHGHHHHGGGLWWGLAGLALGAAAAASYNNYYNYRNYYNYYGGGW
jgi:hypothetical protein